jgi:4-diphosphocytidyl-2-C-methyl-D-erythritol kinase
MSGSGPTVFALAISQEQAQQLLTQVRATIPDPDLELWTAKFIPAGIQVAKP